MKKILTLFTVLLFVFQAQSQNVGGGLGYGSEIEDLGIGAFAQFPTSNSDLLIAPSFVYFFVDDPLSFWEINANINYVFSRSIATVYGIAGLNIARVGIDEIDLGIIRIEESSETELGLNLGIGVDLNIDAGVVPFFETKYAISDFDQLTIYGGIRFPF